MATYTATDAETWSPPVTMFESINSHGEENEPFAVINGRLYRLRTICILYKSIDSPRVLWVYFSDLSGLGGVGTAARLTPVGGTSTIVN